MILGSTGLVGSLLLDLLLEDANYSEIRSLVRKPSGKNHTKLREAVIDFDRLEDHAALFDADDIFCCLGTTIKQAGSQEAFRRVDYEYPLKAAELAKKHGAKKYLIVTAMGSDAKSMIFYNRVKGELEESLMKLDIATLHIFRPSLLLGNRKDHRPGEEFGKLFTSAAGFLLSGPLLKFRPVQGSLVAKAMLLFAREDKKGIFIHLSDVIQKV